MFVLLFCSWLLCNVIVCLLTLVLQEAAGPHAPPEPRAEEVEGEGEGPLPVRAVCDGPPAPPPPPFFIGSSSFSCASRLQSPSSSVVSHVLLYLHVADICNGIFTLLTWVMQAAVGVQGPEQEEEEQEDGEGPLHNLEVCDGRPPAGPLLYRGQLQGI